MLSSLPDPSLAAVYLDYVACLNRRDWGGLGRYVDREVEHNGRLLRLSGYRDMLVRDVEEIPDLRFDARLLVCDPPHVAARLDFRCSPRGRFLGLDVDGRTVSFAEHVFYEFRERRIAVVWSVLDKAAVEAQLAR